MSGQKKLVTAQVLAETLDLSVETIWKYTRERKIPFVELGPRQYRYNYDQVTRALSTGQVREKECPYEEANGKKYTYQDYLTLPEEPGYRYEILEGVLVKEPSPNVMHQRVSRRLHRILEDYFWAVNPEGEVFDAPLDVTFFDITVVQPDLFYISGEQKDIVKETRIDGPPRLIVEIISPSGNRKDRLQKMQIYQKAKVEHYWIVDPEQKTMECFALQENVYARVAAGMDEDLIKPPAFKGLAIELAKLWGENS